MFQYRVPRSSQFRGGTKPKTDKPQEVLLGVIQGKKVPQDEERWFKAAMKTGRVRKIFVQFQLGVQGLPGYRTLDSLIDTDYGWRAFEVDGADWVHRGERKKSMDKLADYQRLNHLRDMGIFPYRGIEHVLDKQLLTQDDADREARRLL